MVPKCSVWTHGHENPVTQTLACRGGPNRLGPPASREGFYASPGGIWEGVFRPEDS